MATPKRTQDIRFGDNLTTVQISLTGAQYSDAQASDDLGGPGPYLVFERGIWKYPQQGTGGRIVIPQNTGKPVRLVHVQADMGASANLEVHIAGIDGTAGRPDNTSGEPYDSGDAALYREGDVLIDTISATQYISKTYDPTTETLSSFLMPGQHLYFVSTAASDPILRATFGIVRDY